MATTNSNQKTFANAKQAVIVRPRSVNQVAFVYRDFSDLKNLIKFVGTKPQIDEEGKLWFRKNMIPDKSIIMRNSYGQVTDVIPFDKADEQFEIVADSDFKPEHANKVEEKTKNGNSKSGMTRGALKEALKTAKVDFKSGLTKEQLQEIYDREVTNKKK